MGLEKFLTIKAMGKITKGYIRFDAFNYFLSAKRP